MPDFGSPMRNVVSDANAGIVNPPSTVKKSTQQVSSVTQDGGKSQKTRVDDGSTQLVMNLGNALQKKLKDKQNNILEQRALDASIRQGLDTAINEQDKLQKRTGWQEAIFGQNVEYRAAQQMAVANTLNNTYLEQLTTIDNYAGETPEEYNQRLKTKLDEALEPHEKDPETKRMISSQWNQHAQKLANKHYANHHGYKLAQARAVYSDNTKQFFDILGVEEQQAFLPEQQEEIDRYTKSFFMGGNKPPTMSGGSWRDVVNENLMASLRGGNIGPYKAAVKHGWIDDLSKEEKVTMEESVSVYDTKYTQDLAAMQSNAQLAAKQVKTFEEAEDVWVNVLAEYEAMKDRSSGTGRAENALSLKNLFALEELDKSEEQSDADFKEDIAILQQRADLEKSKSTPEEAILIDQQLEKDIAERAALTTKNKPNALTTLKALTRASEGINDSEKTVEKLAEERMTLADTEYKAWMEILYLQAEREALEDGTPEGGIEIYDRLHEELLAYQEMLEPPTPSGYKTTAGTHIRGEQARKELEKILATAGKAASKADKERQEMQQLQAALRLKDPTVRSPELTRIDASKPKEEAALDMNIMEDVSKLVGSQETLDQQGTIAAIMSDVGIAETIANRWKGLKVESPLVKNTVEAVINNFNGLIDKETDQITEVGLVALKSIGQFASHTGTFKNSIGNNTFDKYSIIQRGAELKWTGAMINKHLELYDEHQGNMGDYTVSWEMNKNENKTEYIQRLVKEYSGSHKKPTGSALSYYQEEYRRALVVNAGDQKRAQAYLKESVEGAAITFNGQVIPYGRDLNNATNYSFETLMQGAQRLDGETSMLTPYLHNLGIHLEDEDGVTLSSLSQVPYGVEISVQDGKPGFFMDYVNARAPVYISEDVMQQWARTMDEREKTDKLVRDAEDRFLDSWMEIQKAMVM